MSAWLAARTAPGGQAVAVDLDLSLATAGPPGLEPPAVRRFWDGRLAWAREQGIDYFIGRRLTAMLAARGLAGVEATAETVMYNGGSAWAEYWRQTVTELRDRLESSAWLDAPVIDAFLAHCADPAWWTPTIAVTAAHGRLPAG